MLYCYGMIGDEASWGRNLIVECGLLRTRRKDDVLAGVTSEAEAYVKLLGELVTENKEVIKGLLDRDYQLPVSKLPKERKVKAEATKEEEKAEAEETESAGEAEEAVDAEEVDGDDESTTV